MVFVVVLAGGGGDPFVLWHSIVSHRYSVNTQIPRKGEHPTACGIALSVATVSTYENACLRRASDATLRHNPE